MLFPRKLQLTMTLSFVPYCSDRWPRFFRYVNANDQIVDFPVTSALRLAAGQTTNRDIIDFCLSSQGLLLQPIPELLQTSWGWTYVTSRMLTAKQGKDWFSGTARQRREMVKALRPWEYDYVFGKYLRVAICRECDLMSP